MRTPARSALFQHVVNFNKWMLDSFFRDDVLQEIELAACTLSANATKKEINEAQKLLSRRLYALAKDMGFYKLKAGPWTVRLVGMSEAT